MPEWQADTKDIRGFVLVKIFDLTQSIYNEMPVYPGDTGTYLYQAQSLEKDGYTGFRFESGLHAGTHLDSPMHLISTNEGISRISLEQCMGEACLLDVRGSEIIEPRPEFSQKIHQGDIILFLTGWDRYYGQRKYYHEHPQLSEAMVDLLLTKNVEMIGLDWPSPDRSPYLVHKKLLAHHILIIENLTGLERLTGLNRFEVIALPLKIDAEASPVRVVARPI